jgi:hypothetical protein
MVKRMRERRNEKLFLHDAESESLLLAGSDFRILGVIVQEIRARCSDRTDWVFFQDMADDRYFFTLPVE